MAATPIASTRRPADALFSLAAALLWGVMFPVAAEVLESIDAFNLTALRYLGACAILLALLWAVEGPQALRYEGRFPAFLWLGTLGFAGFNLLAYYALEFTQPQNASLIVATTPLMTVLVRWVRDGDRPTPAVLGLIAVALVGVATVLGKGDPSVIVTDGFNTGDVLMLGAVLGWVLYSLGAARHPEFSPLRYTALTAVAGTLSVVAITAALDLTGHAELPSADAVAGEWLPLSYVILGGAVIAVLAWNEGVKRIGPAAGALFMNLVPITAFAVQIARGYDAAAGELAGALITIAAIITANRLAVRAA